MLERLKMVAIMIFSSYPKNEDMSLNQQNWAGECFSNSYPIKHVFKKEEKIYYFVRERLSSSDRPHIFTFILFFYHLLIKLPYRRLGDFINEFYFIWNLPLGKPFG